MGVFHYCELFYNGFSQLGFKNNLSVYSRLLFYSAIGIGLLLISNCSDTCWTQLVPGSLIIKPITFNLHLTCKVLISLNHMEMNFNLRKNLQWCFFPYAILCSFSVHNTEFFLGLVCFVPFESNQCHFAIPQ